MRRRLKKYRWWMLAGLTVLLLWIFCLPSPLFKDPTATLAETNDGTLLGARIADDGQWRFPAADSVPYKFEACILQFEDAYFYQHPGFNPVSMGKALWGNLTAGQRRGASTLTQQVIRLSRKQHSRSYGEKAIELFLATRLEAGYSKEEILSLYASHAPFGGNVVGLEAASWRYFGLPAQHLSWGQMAALAVLPNAPSLIFPGKNEVLLRKKRDFLLRKLVAEGIIDETTYQLALDEPLPGKPFPLPDLASHLTERIQKEHPGKRIVTTIQPQLQKKINTQVALHHRQLSQNEIHNMAVLVLDVTTKDVLAYVGNAPTSKEHHRYVDIIDRARSTGSILKPFLYASLLNSGELLPHTLIADVPTVINGYAPENFNRSFQGAVPASTALSQSLNVPAVRQLQSHGLQRFYNKLQRMEFKSIRRAPNHYGLSLILGGAESSLWEITQAYAGLAHTLNVFNQTSSEYPASAFGTPNYVLSGAVRSVTLQPQPQLFDAGAIYKTFEAMQQVNRPAEEINWNIFTGAQPIAWKTGTSFGFKDAWAVGVTSKYAIGVWVGNADGEGRPGLTGIQAAAPLLFDVLGSLPRSEGFAVPYDALKEVTTCSQSGHLASIFCDQTQQEWIPLRGTRTPPCSYHQHVSVTATEEYRVNSSCYPLEDMIQKSWFSLPPMMEYYYARQHPDYRPLPPFRQGCFQEAEQLMELVTPKPRETILIARDFRETPQEVVFQLAHRSSETKVYWYWEGAFIGTTQTFHEQVLSVAPGTYMLTVIDQQGNQLQQQVVIEFAS
ncbi:penicillin-binding protein 1C [Altibacter sp. HG106]|nr:penicillin-binding protein 1C [Altibacter sp. HG106]MDC7994896.1 penicillin-binding protein 1C [Altibacter sp. HG106]